MSVPEPITIARPGATLAGERWEGEPPPVVLLHAGVADRRGWREVAETLAGDGRRAVVTYDRRGFGGTRAEPAVPFSHLDDLVAVLDAATGGPVTLVGSSMGGALALDAALAVPDRVGALVLIAPAVSGAPEPELDDLDAATRALVERLIAAGTAGDLDAVNRLEVALWLDGPGGEEGRVGGPARELALAMSRAALTGGLGEDAGATGIDAWGRLEEVRAPVLLACGELDAAFALERCRELAARLPRALPVRVLPGVAHLPMLEAPAAVAALVGAVERA